MNATETTARLDRLLATLELGAWRLTRQTRRLLSDEAAALRGALEASIGADIDRRLG